MPESNKMCAVSARQYLVSLGQGFHEVNSSAKDQIRKHFNIQPGCYDLIRLAVQRESPLKVLTDGELQEIKLVEVKSTRRMLEPDFRGYFFSLQYAEQLVAQKLGDRYQFAFVAVLPDRCFHDILRWQDIWARARAIHMQWSIRF
jgi:hypothetical protein